MIILLVLPVSTPIGPTGISGAAARIMEALLEMGHTPVHSLMWRLFEPAATDDYTVMGALNLLGRVDMVLRPPEARFAEQPCTESEQLEVLALRLGIPVVRSLEEVPQLTRLEQWCRLHQVVVHPVDAVPEPMYKAFARRPGVDHCATAETPGQACLQLALNWGVDFPSLAGEYAP